MHIVFVLIVAYAMLFLNKFGVFTFLAAVAAGSLTAYILTLMLPMWLNTIVTVLIAGYAYYHAFYKEKK